VIFADAAMIEQQSQSVMANFYSLSVSFGVFDFQVEVLGRPVAHGRMVEMGAQFVVPGVQGDVPGGPPGPEQVAGLGLAPGGFGAA
jgi:hypothetical protein